MIIIPFLNIKNLVLFGTFTSFLDNARSIKHFNSICLPLNFYAILIMYYKCTCVCACAHMRMRVASKMTSSSLLLHIVSMCLDLSIYHFFFPFCTIDLHLGPFFLCLNFILLYLKSVVDRASAFVYLKRLYTVFVWEEYCCWVQNSMLAILSALQR